MQVFDTMNKKANSADIRRLTIQNNSKSLKVFRVQGCYFKEDFNPLWCVNCKISYKCIFGRLFLVAAKVSLQTCEIESVQDFFMQAGHKTTYRARGKGQLISKGLFDAIVSTKKPTIFFKEFLPQPLKRGQIKKIKALYCTN